MIIDELKKRFKWETQDGKIKVVPYNRYEWKSYPIEPNDTALLLTEDEFIGLCTRIYSFNAALNGVESFDISDFKEFIKTKMPNKAQ